MTDKTEAMDNLIAQDADLIEICPDGSRSGGQPVVAQQKTLAVANNLLGINRATLGELSHNELMTALVLIVQQSEAFKQEVSDAVGLSIKRTNMTEISKEWCINMAKQEEGDIGAGKLAIDPTSDNFHKLALNGSFGRVAKVAEERAAFNEQMALREVLMAVTQDDRNAAASLYLKTEGEPYSLHDKATAAEIEMGVHDDWDCVQAFAAHRHLVLSDPAQNNAGGLWYRRWFQAMTLNDALEARGLEIREKGNE